MGLAKYREDDLEISLNYRTDNFNEFYQDIHGEREKNYANSQWSIRNYSPVGQCEAEYHADIDEKDEEWIQIIYFSGMKPFYLDWKKLDQDGESNEKGQDRLLIGQEPQNPGIQYLSRNDEKRTVRFLCGDSNKVAVEIQFENGEVKSYRFGYIDEINLTELLQTEEVVSVKIGSLDYFQIILPKNLKYYRPETILRGDQDIDLLMDALFSMEKLPDPEEVLVLSQMLVVQDKDPEQLIDLLDAVSLPQQTYPEAWFLLKAWEIYKQDCRRSNPEKSAAFAMLLAMKTEEAANLIQPHHKEDNDWIGLEILCQTLRNQGKILPSFLRMYLPKGFVGTFIAVLKCLNDIESNEMSAELMKKVRIFKSTELGKFLLDLFPDS